MDRLTYTFQPVFNLHSRILILGTFPSVKSREGEFYYHHPQNRFWRVISTLCHEKLPVSINEKTEMLLRNGIAVWDVIKSCEIIGSADSSIKNIIPNDLSVILNYADIKCIIANGSTAYKLYMKHIYPDIGRKIIKLPSTSPANAAFSLNKLIEDWSYVLNISDGNAKG